MSDEDSSRQVRQDDKNALKQSEISEKKLNEQAAFKRAPGAVRAHERYSLPHSRQSDAQNNSGGTTLNITNVSVPDTIQDPNLPA